MSGRGVSAKNSAGDARPSPSRSFGAPTAPGAAVPGAIERRLFELDEVEIAVVVAVDDVAGQCGIAPVHVAQEAFLRDELRGVGEDLAALGVIPVAVAQDHVLHRLARKLLRELRLEPLRERHAQRVDEQQALRRVEDRHVPAAVVRAVDIALHMRDVAARRREHAGRAAGACCGAPRCHRPCGAAARRRQARMSQRARVQAR